MRYDCWEVYQFHARTHLTQIRIDHLQILRRKLAYGCVCRLDSIKYSLQFLVLPGNSCR